MTGDMMFENQAESGLKSFGDFWRFVLRRGLARTLLFWFLALALIPLTIVSLISYRDARRSLSDEVTKNLWAVSQIKADFIEFHFNRWIIDLNEQAERTSNVRFLESLKKALADSNKQSHDFVKSYKWAQIVDEYSSDLRTFQKAYGYYDVFLIDLDGNILFSLAEEGELGTNLSQSPYSNTLFARAVEKALETGRPVFSDFELYEPSGGIVAGFIASVLVDDLGEKLGVIAFQIPNDLINTAMSKREGLGLTGQTYLIGQDLILRTLRTVGREGSVLKEKIETTQSAKWYREHISGEGKEIDNKSDVITYPGPDGREVLGIHRNVDIAGLKSAVIVEIETSEAFAAADDLGVMVIVLLAATGLAVFLLALILARRIVYPLRKLSTAAGLVSRGDLNQDIQIATKNEIGELAENFNSMIGSLRTTAGENETQAWFKNGESGLNDQMRGEHDMADLCRNIVTYLANYLNAQVGAIFIADNGTKLQLLGSYAFQKRKGMANVFKYGEGLVGQAALEKKSILVTHVPGDYMAVSSGLGETPPQNILVFPFLYENEVKGVLELGSLNEFSDLDQDFLTQVAQNIAIAVNAEINRQRMRELLEQTQVQTGELRAREEELSENNKVLGKQAEDLRESETRLKEQQVELEESNQALQAQQEELRAINEEMEEKSEALERSSEETQVKNRELNLARSEIEQKAEDLELTSRYKSEFLANMSHELRTPLNSLLILSNLLKDNKDGNLDEKQVEFARTIHGSGTDLLHLINEILDLSKIESGKMEVSPETLDLADIIEELRQKFSQTAKEKGLSLILELAEIESGTFNSDRQKLIQILSNLLSNSLKFTEQGSVTVEIKTADQTTGFLSSGKNQGKTLAFVVSDTGIGIPPEKQKMIFEAFQQADGTTRRKYGGTGLGLSISRELTKLLGGELKLKSDQGLGSEFILLLPWEAGIPGQERIQASPLIGRPVAEVPVEDPVLISVMGPQVGIQSQDIEEVFDDRRKLKAGERSMLIIEDDPKFAGILCDLARERGFKSLIAGDGETGLHFADYYKPSGIILDVGLPGLNGWAVMERLKDNLDTRHIPVHFISAVDRTSEALRSGAIGYMTKPVDIEGINEAFSKIENVIDRPVKDMLIVEDDEVQRTSIAELIGNGDVKITMAADGREARALLKSKTFDCVILDLKLPDTSGSELLEFIRQDNRIFQTPVIVYTGKELTDEERATLDEYAERMIIKGRMSPERLLDDTALFLHRVAANLPEDKRRVIRMLHDPESLLKGKTVLLVDDDMRNLYALSHVLQEKEMKIVMAKNGKEGLERLKETPEIDAVIMDIMMPVMDGYEAMREIRKQKRFRDLPIITLTAKAMKGDRGKCIEAGASDYLAKPVDPAKLMSMLRVWLY